MLLFQSILVYGMFALFLWFVASHAKNNQSPQFAFQQNNNILPQYWFCIFLFCLISGIRWDVGVDHVSYVADYIDMCKGQYYERERGFEPAYLLISQAFAQLGVHYIFYMAFLAFLEIYFIFLFNSISPTLLVTFKLFKFKSLLAIISPTSTSIDMFSLYDLGILISIFILVLFKK